MRATLNTDDPSLYTESHQAFRALATRQDLTRNDSVTDETQPVTRLLIHRSTREWLHMSVEEVARQWAGNLNLQGEANE